MHNDVYASWPLTFVHGAGHYRQIADFIASAVAANRMQPGDRLPPQQRLWRSTWGGPDHRDAPTPKTGQRGLIRARGPQELLSRVRPEQPLQQMLDLGMNMPPLPTQVAICRTCCGAAWPRSPEKA